MKNLMKFAKQKNIQALTNKQQMALVGGSIDAICAFRTECKPDANN